MHPILGHVPVWLALVLGGGVAGMTLAGGDGHSKLRLALAALGGVALGLTVGHVRGWLYAEPPLQLPLYSYGFCVLAGLVTGIWLAARRSELIGVPPGHILDMGLWGVAAGIVGARLFHVVENFSSYNPFGSQGPRALLGILQLWEGGLVFFGAFIAAIVAAVIYCRIRGHAVIPFLDLASPGLIAGHALGRIGCFLNGCCYGKETALPWGVSFPPGSYVQEAQFPKNTVCWSRPVHPTELYGFLGAALVTLFLYTLWPRRRYDGQVFGWMLVLAGATRFFEEFLRADNPVAFPSVSATLTIAQWVGLVLVPAGCVWLLILRRRDVLYRPPPELSD